MVSEGRKKDLSKMSLRMTNDDGFFSRLMAKESTSPDTPSSRIFYYGETSVAVPFTWEAQPGTPKHPLSVTSLPPLTPPPSYFSSSPKSHTAKAKPKFSTIFPRFLLGSRKSHHHASPSSSSSSPSSSSSSSSSWSYAYYSTLPSFSIRDKYPPQGTCPSFSRPLKHKSSNGFRGCYPFGNLRNANLSHGVD